MGLLDYLGCTRSREKLLRGEVPKWVSNSKRAPYIAQVLLSAPPWVDLKALRALQAKARWITEMEGKLHVLDHKIPLKHPLVCGLTVPWNLRVIPWEANLSKGNEWNPDQAELFEDPTDLCMSDLSLTRSYPMVRVKQLAVGSGQAQPLSGESTHQESLTLF